MKNAVLAFLLALAGHVAPPSTTSAPPGLMAQHPGPAPAMLLGVWQGTQRARGATAPSPLEVAFADGVRPSTVFGYFIFGDSQGASRLRRLGVLTNNRVTFALPDRGAITLWPEGRRLVGNLADHGQESAIELARVREAGRVDVAVVPRAVVHDLLTRPDAHGIDAAPNTVMQR